MAIRFLQQELQLLIRQGHVGTHHHQARQRATIRGAAAQPGQAGGIQRLRPWIRQGSHQARRRTEQKAFLAAQGPHRSPKGTQLLLLLRIHHHRHVAPQ